MVTTILRGVVGSQAHGFATGDSDTDYGSVFMRPVIDFLGTNLPTDKDLSTQTHDPDEWGQEVGKFVRLALNGSPTILELLFLPEHELVTPEGVLLLDIRRSFLSQQVYYSYAGFAKSQLELSGSDNPARILKARRHCLRCLTQAANVLRTGDLVVRMTPLEVAHIRNSIQTEGTFNEEREALAADLHEAMKFCIEEHVLPLRPDRTHAVEALHKIRTLQIRREHP